MSLPIQRGMSGNFATQRATYTYEKKGSRSGLKGAVVIVLKSARAPKIKTPSISWEKAPDCAGQSQQIGLNAYANHSPLSSEDP